MARPRPGRRAVLAGLGLALALGPVAAAAEPLRRVLFVGNSFTFEQDLPGRVATLAAASGRPVETHTLARPGARLAGHATRPEVLATLGRGWEAVVLQDHSTEALHEDRRAQSLAAVRLLGARAGRAAVVLVVPWSRAAGHPLYAEAAAPGYAAPRDPAAMTRLNTLHWAGVAAATGAHLAPVASAWEGAIAGGAALHAADGYHASPEGAALAAAVIWRSLAPLLP